MFKNELMSVSYESPSLVMLQVESEGILCESSGTETLDEVLGSWSYCDDDRFLYANNVDGLVFKNNTFKKNDTLPSHPTGVAGGMNLKEAVTNSIIEAPEMV